MLKTIHKLVLKSFLGPLVVTFFIVFFVGKKMLAKEIEAEEKLLTKK